MKRDLLNETAIAGALEKLRHWERKGNLIRRTVKCRDFVDALSVTVKIGFAAEKLDHHPDIDIRYNSVHVSLSTHSAGGITAFDIELARRIDELVGQ